LHAQVRFGTVGLGALHEGEADVLSSEEMERLLARGLRSFQFVDRTFNLGIAHATAILRFFRERWTPGLFVHFELIPDRLPDELRAEIAAFPPGALQFEVGALLG
jgi:radical SAM superfamily enzyme YgiQ (UPF0313 family)